MSNPLILMEVRGFANREVDFNKLSRGAQRAILIEGFDAVVDELVKGAAKIRNSAIDDMRKSPPDTTAFKFARKGRHYPSFPFRAPRPDSGDLIRSLLTSVDTGFSGTEVRMGSTILEPPYPLWLEEGTDKMAPRPWLYPAYEKHRDEAYRRASQALRNSAIRILNKEFRGG